MRNVTISAAVSFDDYQELIAAVSKTRLTLSSYVALAIQQMLPRSPEEIEGMRRVPAARKKKAEAGNE